MGWSTIGAAAVQGGKDMKGRGKMAIIAVSAAALTLGMAGGGATAVAKKSCKKPGQWKCAPQRYKLKASGTTTGSNGSEVWSAEIILGKRRASPGTIDYSQNSGKVTVSGSGFLSFDDHCTGFGKPAYSVPEQTLDVPRRPVYGSDFGVTFSLTGDTKNKYAVGVGAPQVEFSNVKGTATVTCPEGGSHSHDYFYTSPFATVIPLIARGKVGSSPLRGSEQFGGSSLSASVTWKLIAKK
jgi:hypothetical protein